MAKRVDVVVIFFTRLRDTLGSGLTSPDISRNIPQSPQTDAGLYLS